MTDQILVYLLSRNNTMRLSHEKPLHYGIPKQAVLLQWCKQITPKHWAIEAIDKLKEWVMQHCTQWAVLLFMTLCDCWWFGARFAPIVNMINTALLSASVCGFSYHNLLLILFPLFPSADTWWCSQISKALQCLRQYVSGLSCCCLSLSSLALLSLRLCKYSNDNYIERTMYITFLPTFNLPWGKTFSENVSTVNNHRL